MDCKGCIYAYKQHGFVRYSKREQKNSWVSGKKEMCVLHGEQRENCKDKIIEED